ncbi:PAS domain-containing protein [Breoghania sp.]|uniref:PAS domain-containing protein n=1 Tax=Breoghania sp. TaxID=2065378 RepID=UPI00260EED23|nr:PAS domain-containing protein [Breoghania sp.]MDJ0933657.1 PAS domain-containing protein [Breoghania sp.]
MKHATTQALYGYWNRLRGSKPAPERSEIEPGDIRTILGDTFILEALGDEGYRFRLAGTRMCAAYCRELKGRDFLRMWSDKDREAMETMLQTITNDAAAAVLGVESRTDRGQSVDLEILLLRMRYQGYARILGSCAMMEKPYWIGIHPVVSQSISSLRLIWPDEQPFFLRKVNAGREGHAVAPASHLAYRRVGHLTVYEGGKNQPEA